MIFPYPHISNGCPISAFERASTINILIEQMLEKKPLLAKLPKEHS
jgi:hypothetical protein